MFITPKPPSPERQIPAKSPAICISSEGIGGHWRALEAFGRYQSHISGSTISSVMLALAMQSLILTMAGYNYLMINTMERLTKSDWGMDSSSDI